MGRRAGDQDDGPDAGPVQAARVVYRQTLAGANGGLTRGLRGIKAATTCVL